MINLPNIHWEDPDIGLVIEATVKIEGANVEVVCNANHDDWDGVFTRAFDMVRAAADSYAFVNGYGFIVWLETVTKPDGIRYNIVPRRPDLASLVTAFDNSQSAEMLATVYSDPLIFMALNDLIASITLPHHAPVNCGRAMESIREVMSPVKGDKIQGWQTMRDNLRIDINYLNFITKESTGPRHGIRSGITPLSFQETIRRSWIVMNRFLEFKKRGGRQLPPADFPVLVS